MNYTGRMTHQLRTCVVSQGTAPTEDLKPDRRWLRNVESAKPFIDLNAGDEKNGRGNDIPIRNDLAEELRLVPPNVPQAAGKMS